MKIPVTVITGFLGAGKTTTIRHLLENARGKRIALIINEFGDLGIDRDVLTGCNIKDCHEDDVVELANGCICCTVADDFLPTLESLIERDHPPDHIVIETSGLALPKPLVQAFNWPEIRTRATVDGVVALIDAPAVAEGKFADNPAAVQASREQDDALDHVSPLEEVFEDQLYCADIVILNKSDLIPPEKLEQVRKNLVETVQNGVQIIPTRYGHIDVNVLLGVGASVEGVIGERPSHHDEDEHDHDDFDSIVVTLEDLDETAILEHRLRLIVSNHDILRVKGFVHIREKPMRQVVQAVGNRIQCYFDREWHSNEDRVGRLVVIGKAGFDQDAVRETLRG